MNELPTLTMKETVEELRRLVQHLDTMTRFAAEDEIEDLEEAIEILVALNGIKSSFATTYSNYEEVIADGMDDEYMVKLPGDIEVTRREGAPRKQWDHKRLTKDVTKRLMDKSVDYETGEILMTTEEIINAVFQYAATSYWRVKELKKIGLNADKYSKLGDPKVSVAISRKGGKG